MSPQRGPNRERDRKFFAHPNPAGSGNGFPCSYANVHRRSPFHSVQSSPVQFSRLAQTSSIHRPADSDGIWTRRAPFRKRMRNFCFFLLLLLGGGGHFIPLRHFALGGRLISLHRFDLIRQPTADGPTECLKPTTMRARRKLQKKTKKTKGLCCGIGNVCESAANEETNTDCTRRQWA